MRHPWGGRCARACWARKATSNNAGFAGCSRADDIQGFPDRHVLSSIVSVPTAVASDKLFDSQPTPIIRDGRERVQLLYLGSKNRGGTGHPSNGGWKEDGKRSIRA